MNIGKWQIMWHNPFRKFTDADEDYNEYSNKEPETIGFIFYYPTFGYRFNALSGIYKFVMMLGYLDIRRFK